LSRVSGKTLQSISILAYLKDTKGSRAGPHIVIVPKTTVSNWMREFARWCPSIRAIRLLGSKEDRKVVCRDQILPGDFDVLVSSYESCLKEKATIMKIKWDYLIIDEVGTPSAYLVTRTIVTVCNPIMVSFDMNGCAGPSHQERVLLPFQADSTLPLSAPPTRHRNPPAGR
jgi:hypothetical protein